MYSIHLTKDYLYFTYACVVYSVMSLRNRAAGDGENTSCTFLSQQHHRKQRAWNAGVPLYRNPEEMYVIPLITLRQEAELRPHHIQRIEEALSPITLHSLTFSETENEQPAER
jgi:hypothetical protein